MLSLRTFLNNCSHLLPLAGIGGILPGLTMFLLAVWTMYVLLLQKGHVLCS